MDEGSLLNTPLGPFVVCEVCRTLYYIDIVTNYENKPVIVIQPAKLEPEQEFQIIRTANSRTPLKDYLDRENEGQIEKANINPHFNKDLKTIINEAVTPSDIIRKLND
jgi:hypothetical protein